MTKVRKKKFMWKSKRQEAMVMSCIRELKNKEFKNYKIIKFVQKEFKIDVHVRTIDAWIKKQSCIHSDKWVAEQKIMDGWHKELTPPKELPDPNEVALEELYDTANKKGYCLI